MQRNFQILIFQENAMMIKIVAKIKNVLMDLALAGVLIQKQVREIIGLANIP